MRERARGKGVLAEDVAVQGRGDGGVKQVSNSVHTAASGKDPDSHQSITVWWFLTKEVQGKNSSGGDLNPASCGGSHCLVNAHKKRGTGLLVATWTSRLTSCRGIGLSTLQRMGDNLPAQSLRTGRG